MAFQNGIKNSWGGRPYIDLVKGFEYIESNLDYVDTSRSVALGASYGGYMVRKSPSQIMSIPLLKVAFVLGLSSPFSLFLAYSKHVETIVL